MDHRQKRYIAAILFAAYYALLVLLIVFKDIPTIHIGHRIYKLGGQHTGPANLVPFKSIGPLLSGQGNRLMAKVNLLGNILPFMPVGFLAPFIYRRLGWGTAFVLAVATGLSMEVMELVFQTGIFDVDDIMMNAFGVLLGFAVFRIVRVLFRADEPERSRPYARL